MTNDTDNYLYFNYNGINSSVYNAFIINEGEDLKFSSFPSFSNKTETSFFGNTTYLLGTTKESREISFDVMLQDVTLKQYKQFIAWLTTESDQCQLSFDYNKNYYYNAKINSIGDGNFTVNAKIDGTQTYNIEVSLEFITINDWAAIFNNDSFIALDNQITTEISSINYDNDTFIFNINRIDSDSDSEYGFNIEIYNNGQLPIFLDMNVHVTTINKTKYVTVQKETDINTYSNIYKIPNSLQEYNIYGKYGLILNTNDEFVTTTINEGILEIPIGLTRIKILEDSNDSNDEIKLYPILRDII